MLACGQYAWLNAQALASVTDGVVVDEPEGMIAQLLAYARGEVTASQVDGIFTGTGTRPKPRRCVARDWQLPARDLFPPIASHPEHDTEFGLLGNIEATRGCHHRCSYCTAPCTPPTG
ncbi:MAG TPA: hypothetical protein DHU96_05500 [Actinobacteria bacterium]|nr:hypothetical protein [Actinomycetota bacterium]